MIETATQHTYIVTIDRTSLQTAQIDWVWRLILQMEVIEFKASEQTVREDGMYYRADLTF